MKTTVRILCVDDEKNVLRALVRLFMDDDYEIITAESGSEGLRALETEGEIQVIISDYRMPGMDGVEFLKEVCENWPDTVRIVLSGYADTAAVVAAINEGQIYKFIPKPWNDDELKITIAKAIETFFLQRKNIKLSKELQESNEELKTLNENLEELVRERTSELEFQNAVLSRAQKILHTLPAGIIGMDDEGVIVQINNRLCEMLNRNPAELLTHKAAGTVPLPFLEYIESVAEQSSLSAAFEHRGERIIVQGVSIDGQDGKTGNILLFVPDAPGS